MAISSRPPLEAEMREEVFLSNHGALTGLQTEGEEQICTGQRAVFYFVFIFFLYIFLNGE